MSAAIDELIELINQGNLDLAAENTRIFLKSTPDSAELHNVMGVIMQQQGKLEPALRYFKKAVKLNPLFSPAYSNIGSLHLAANKIDKAIRYTKKAVDLNPDDAIGLNNLGNALALTGQHESAELYFRKAIQRLPRFSPPRNNLALLFIRSGRLDQALASADETLEMDGSSIDAYMLKISVLELQNKLDDAEAFYEIIPDDIRTMIKSTIAKARLDYRRRKYSDVIDKLDRVLRTSSNIAIIDRAEIHYLLGASREKTSDFTGALREYGLANSARAATTEAEQFNKLTYLNEIKRIRKAFDNFDNTIHADRERNGPVFLIGFPRSGNTLLNKVLSGHPDISVLDERPVSNQLLNSLSAVNRNGELFPHLTTDKRRELQTEYFNNCYAEGADKNSEVIIDKMPFNIIHAAQLHHVFPGAKFIFCLRLPCDAIFSSFKNHFQPNHAVSNFYTLEDTANLYHNMMSLWRVFTERSPIAFHYVYYEAFVENTPNAMSRLAAFIGLDWRTDYFQRMDNNIINLNVLTPSYRQVYNPIDQQSAYFWLNYQDALRPHMDKITPWISYFGYLNEEDRRDLA